MISELLRLAELNGLTGHEAFRARPIDWIVDIDQDGNLLGLSPTARSARGTNSSATRAKLYDLPRNYHMQVRDGAILSVCTNQSNWMPDFLIAPAEELFRRGVDGKQDSGFAKRRMTWALYLEALRELPATTPIKAVMRFLRRHPAFDASWLPPATADERDSAVKRIAKGEHMLSFRVNGNLICQCPELRAWWRARVIKERGQVMAVLPAGTDFYQNGVGKLTEYAPVVFNSIPFVSYDKAPFISFGLGKQTTPYRLETVEKAAAALNWLLANDDCNMQLGDLTAVFWAAGEDESGAADFTRLLAEADPLSVKDFLSGVWASRETTSDLSRFYAAVLSRSKGRFAVRGWHTETLPNAQANTRRWLAAIAIPVPYHDDPRYSSIRELTLSTVQQGKKSRPPREIYLALFKSALFSVPLPEKLLAAAIARQRVEVSLGAKDKRSRREFEDRLAARTVLIKLYFELTKGVSMTDMSEKNAALERDAGYLCGRLLAVLDKIHVAAHKSSGGTNSSPANRSYAAASTTPALIFPQLCQIARYHLNKIGGGWAHDLEFGRADVGFDGLAAICARLRNSAAGEFPTTLSLQEQGRFAIGFYYERCRRWPKREATKNAESEAASTNDL